MTQGALTLADLANEAVELESLCKLGLKATKDTECPETVA